MTTALPLRRLLRLLLPVTLCAGVFGSTTARVSSASELASTIGMYTGNDNGDRFARFERELGKQIRYVVTMADTGSPASMRQSVWGQFASPDAYLPGVADRVDVISSVPLAFGPVGMAKTLEGQQTIRTNLFATAAGQFDEDYRVVARHLKNAGFGDAIIRLGWEFDGLHPPYSARNGNNDAFIAAFRHVHDVLTAESPAFRFEWTPMAGSFITHGLPAYPGNGYVDIIGMDIYFRESDEVTDAAWNGVFLEALEAQRAFAVSNGKSLSYAEWGRAKADTPRFIDLMHGWFANLPATGPGRLVYQAYFNPAGPTDKYAPYNLDLLPNVKSRYIELFGGGTESPVTPTTVVAPPVTAPPSAPPVTVPPSAPPVTVPPSAPPVTVPPSAPPVTAPPSAPPVTAPPSAPPVTAPPRVAGPVAVGELLTLTAVDVCAMVGRDVVSQVMGMNPAERTGALPESYGPSCIFTGNGGIGIQFHRYGPQGLANLATMHGKTLTDVDVAGRKALVSDFSSASKQMIVWLGEDPDPALVVYAATLEGAVTVADAVLTHITD